MMLKAGQSYPGASHAEGMPWGTTKVCRPLAASWAAKTAGTTPLAKPKLTSKDFAKLGLAASIASRHRRGGASQSRRSRDTVLHIAELHHVSGLKTQNPR